jgi:putative DNA primase/helicase
MITDSGLPVLVAFDAGNLRSVAELARRKYPDRQIILCADYDDPTDQVPQAGGVGVKAATDAAIAVNGLLAVPRLSGRKADFNDVHQKMGAAEVLLQFQTARKPDPPKPKADPLPAGFVLRSGGLYHVEQKEGAAPDETWLGPPLHVLGATRDEHGGSWGVLLRWEDPDGTTHTWAMPSALLVGRDNAAWLGHLADEGWIGAPGNQARKLLALYLTTCRPKQRVLCVPRTGWHRGVFVLPDKVIENLSDVSDVSDGLTAATSLAVRQEKSMSDVSDVEHIVLQTPSAHNPFRMGGTLEGWQNSTGKWSRGNSRLILTLCTSLAGPLLEPSGMESGGFNFVGQSSTGKTTALIVAGSVWGKGSSAGGYVLNWRATSNGLEGLAALHSDAALCLDEIGQAPGRTIQEASYMLANGMGKARASQDGTAREVKHWRCLVLSTGEKGLADKIVEEGGKVQAGQAVRLIDVPADADAGMGLFENLHGHTDARAFADALKRAGSTDYGHAARAFIEAFQKHRETAVSQLNEALSSGIARICHENASGQVQRVAKRFLLCGVAGEMASDWGVLPWKRGEALAAVKKCFDAWIVLRGGDGAAEDTAILEQVSLFLEQHGQSRFQNVEIPDANCINRVGFRRKTEEGMEFLILPESFRAEVCKGLSPRLAVKVLLDRGLLLRGDGNNLTRQSPVPLPGLGRKRCYTILLKEAFPGVD